MGKTTIDGEQIGKIHELLGNGLRKSGLPKDGVQKVLDKEDDELDELVDEMIEPLRMRVDAISK